MNVNFTLAAVMVFSLTMVRCATNLSRSGAEVHVFEGQPGYSCRYLARVRGENSMGSTTAQDKLGAMNELRNRAAELGANAVRVTHTETSLWPGSSWAEGEALECDFGSLLRQLELETGSSQITGLD